MKNLFQRTLTGCLVCWIRWFRSAWFRTRWPLAFLADEPSPRNELQKWSTGAACDGSVLQSKQNVRFGYRIGRLRSQLVIQSKHAITKSATATLEMEMFKLNRQLQSSGSPSLICPSSSTPGHAAPIFREIRLYLPPLYSGKTKLQQIIKRTSIWEIKAATTDYLEHRQ